MGSSWGLTAVEFIIDLEAQCVEDERTRFLNFQTKAGVTREYGEG